MRDPNRINDMITIVEDYWTRYPDLRLGQLLLNCVPESKDLYYVEDENLLVLMDSYYNKQKNICKHDGSRKLVNNSKFVCTKCGEVVREAIIAKLFDIT